MRISDWSSDVCSSDLCEASYTGVDAVAPAAFRTTTQVSRRPGLHPRHALRATSGPTAFALQPDAVPVREIRRAFIRGLQECEQIGRAACRERVCQYV